jgi:hypothetical protein
MPQGPIAVSKIAKFCPVMARSNSFKFFCFELDAEPCI